MHEFLVLLKDGSEASIFAATKEAAIQEAKERGLQPAEAKQA
jgi:hypothetical protein